MSGSGDNSEWLVDGVSVGSGRDAAQEERPGPVADAAAAVGGSTPGAPAGGDVGAQPQFSPVGAPGATATPPAVGATGTIAAGTAPPPGPAAGQRRRRWIVVVLGLLVLVGFVLVVVFVFFAGGAPSYEVTSSDHPISMSAEGAFVGVGVKNTGSATGAPTCTARVTSPAGTVLGKVRFTEKSLDPGKSILTVKNVKLPQAAALSPTRTKLNVSVTCT